MSRLLIRRAMALPLFAVGALFVAIEYATMRRSVIGAAFVVAGLILWWRWG